MQGLFQGKTTTKPTTRMGGCPLILRHTCDFRASSPFGTFLSSILQKGYPTYCLASFPAGGAVPEGWQGGGRNFPRRADGVVALKAKVPFGDGEEAILKDGKGAPHWTRPFCVEIGVPRTGLGIFPTWCPFKPRQNKGTLKGTLVRCMSHGQVSNQSVWGPVDSGIFAKARLHGSGIFCLYLTKPRSFEWTHAHRISGFLLAGCRNF